MDNIKNYILFPSYNYGMKLESALKKEKIKFTIVPTPRELSASCGISIEYKKEDEQRIKVVVEENSIKVTGFYSLEKNYTTFYK
jgi:uncharacterized protein YpmS